MYFLLSPQTLGKIPIVTSIFFRWVVEPPTRFKFDEAFVVSSGPSLLLILLEKVGFSGTPWICRCMSKVDKIGLHSFPMGSMYGIFTYIYTWILWVY